MGTARVALGLGEAACESCHVSPHGAQFARRGDHGSCASCHDVYSFKPASRFDHDRDTRFPLLRAHARAACSRCHLPKADPSGTIVTIYRPLTVACEGCHAALKVDLGGSDLAGL
jgi:hypothetical protein